MLKEVSMIGINEVCENCGYLTNNNVCRNCGSHKESVERKEWS